MSRLALSAALALLIPASAAAQLTLVARADFNADVVGESPDLSLPGPPDGDSMTVSPTAPGTYTVVASSGSLSDQPLEMQREEGGAGSLLAGFHFPETAYPCDRFVVKWCSVARTVIPPSFFVLRGPQGRIYGSVNYRGPSITILTSGAEETVGSWTLDQANCFEWHVDTAGQTQTLLIDGVVVAEDLPTTPVTGDVTYFQYEPSFTNAFTFAIDDVEVWVEDCETPIAPASWARVKSVYRTF